MSNLYLEPGLVYAYDDQIAVALHNTLSCDEDTWEDMHDSKMTENYLSAYEQFTAVLENVVQRPSFDCSTSIRCLEIATWVLRTVLHLLFVDVRM